MRSILLALACLAGLFASPAARAQSVLSDPCSSAPATLVPISITTAAATQQVTGATNKKIYVCEIVMIAGAADNVAVIEGTGTNCGTGTAALAGGTTSANGLNFGSNGGLIAQRTGFSHFWTQTAGDNICLTASSAGPLSGWLLEVTQ